MKPKIFIANYIEKKALEILSEVFDPCTSIKECIGMWTHLEPYRINNELEFIATPCTGIDHLDTKIKILHLDDKEWLYKNIWATAEHTIGLIFTLLKSTAKKEKQRNIRNEELREKTLGIIGNGRVGKQVAELAYNLGMNVVAKDLNYYCIYQKQENQINYKKINMTFEEFLKVSDVISIHVPLNKNTIDLITSIEFEKMKDTAYLINTSRSNVVNGKDLYEALCYQKIKGAGIDVIEGYSEDIKKCLYAIADSTFIITPHTAGFTKESREKTDIWLAKKVVEYWTNRSI